MAHESAPKNFTAVDVTDLRNPKMILQTDLPHNDVRSNSLDIVGDIMAVAYQTKKWGLKPAGMDLFDISTPEKPKLISHFDTSGPHSRGAHCVFFVDGEYVHLTSGSADFEPTNPKDDQFYRIIDVRQPTRPTEVGRWWLPGTRDGDPEPAPTRHPVFDAGFRAHNTNVYPQRPDRAWVGYLDGGAVILDIADKAHPTVVSRWDYHPPFPGFTHTVLPLLSRGLMIVSDEAVRNGGEDWPKLVWVVDVREETNPVPVATCPLPPLDEFKGRGGRYGAHNLHENRPAPGAWASDTVIVGTFFNGGVRAFDVSDPLQPKEVAYHVPAAPRGTKAGAVQINDVFVDERGIVYAVDRFTGGLYVLEMTL
jgi:hypothetical protein